MGLNAQEYKVEKLWGTEDVPNPNHSYRYDYRQGVGLGGKFYISSQLFGQIYIYGENGFEGTLKGSPNNFGINTDQAGHLIVSLAIFPNTWICDNATPMIRVIDPTTGATMDLPLSARAPVNQRLDVLGRAYGNLMDEGELYVPNAEESGINRYFFRDGKLIAGECYIARVYQDNEQQFLNCTTQTIVSAVVDAEGNDAVFYYHRGPSSYLCYWNGSNLELECALYNYVPEQNTLLTAGADFFAFNGKNFLVVPYAKNESDYHQGHLDGFAIIEIGSSGSSSPLFIKEPTGDTNYNPMYSNWLNAEVTEDGVLIYQYVPDKSMEVYKMTLANETIKGNLNGDGQVDVSDVSIAIDIVLGKANYDALADLDGNGSVDVTDVSMIIDIVLGK